MVTVKDCSTNKFGHLRSLFGASPIADRQNGNEEGRRDGGEATKKVIFYSEGKSKTRRLTLPHVRCAHQRNTKQNTCPVFRDYGHQRQEHKA